MPTQAEIEFASFRKRARREQDLAAERARRDIVLGLIDLVDDLDRALATVDDPGLISLRNRAVARFGAAGYQPFGERGDIFDPELHMAIEAVVTDQLSANQIITCHQLGWRNAVSGELLREATVTVVKISESGSALAPPTAQPKPEPTPESGPDPARPASADPDFAQSAPVASINQADPDDQALSGPDDPDDAHPSPQRVSEASTDKTFSSDPNHVCPVDFPGCQGDCPVCRAIGAEANAETDDEVEVEVEVEVEADADAEDADIYVEANDQVLDLDPSAERELIIKDAVKQLRKLRKQRQTVQVGLNPEQVEAVLQSQAAIFRQGNKIPDRVGRGDQVILYASGSEKAAIGSAIVQRAVAGDINQVWLDIGGETGLSEEDFWRSANGVTHRGNGGEKVTVISLETSERFSQEIPVAELFIRPSQINYIDTEVKDPTRREQNRKFMERIERGQAETALEKTEADLDLNISLNPDADLSDEDKQ